MIRTERVPPNKDATQRSFGFSGSFEVLAAERPAVLQLNAKGLDYVIWGGLAVTVLVVERTRELMRLHQKIIDAVRGLKVRFLPGRDSDLTVCSTYGYLRSSFF